MAYNNYFPQYYQPMQAQPQMPQPQPVPQPIQQNNNSMIWIQGEAGAKSYLLAPNTTLPLWDSESQTIYLKSTDASGMPSMKILDYTIRDNAVPQAPVQIEQPNYVTHEELKKFEQEIKSQIKNLNKRGVKDDKQSNSGNSNDKE